MIFFKGLQISKKIMRDYKNRNPQKMTDKKVNKPFNYLSKLKLANTKYNIRYY